MKPPLLAAAIIVKNEADHLRRCLKSVSRLCDVVVVVDTGSTDDTIAVALAHGAAVLHREWDGDFSAARNLGLDHIDAQWILYIDADEEVQPCDVEAVRTTLAAADGTAAFVVRFAVHVGWTPYWEYRVWRHRPDVRFRNRIHETMLPDLRRIIADEGQRVERLNIEMQHYGYEGDQTAKHHRNLPLLEEQVRITPERVYLWNHLGRCHGALGDATNAEAAYRQGIEVVRRHGGLPEPVDILVYGSLALFLLAQGRDASDIIVEGLALDPEHYTLQLASAQQHIRSGNAPLATEILHGLIAVGERNIDHPVLAYNRALFTDVPWRLLGECLFDCEQYADSAVAFERAAEYGAESLEMRTKAAAARSLASRNEQSRAK